MDHGDGFIHYHIKNNWTLEMGELYGVSYISKKKKKAV